MGPQYVATTTAIADGGLLAKSVAPNPTTTTLFCYCGAIDNIGPWGQAFRKVCVKDGL